jgi:hypothetical protein
MPNPRQSKKEEKMSEKMKERLEQIRKEKAELAAKVSNSQQARQAPWMGYQQQMPPQPYQPQPVPPLSREELDAQLEINERFAELQAEEGELSYALRSQKRLERDSYVVESTTNATITLSNERYRTVRTLRDIHEIRFDKRLEKGTLIFSSGGDNVFTLRSADDCNKAHKAWESVVGVDPYRT